LAATTPPGARIARAEGAISSEIDGEAVILEIESGQIFHLNRLGSRIWRMLDDAPSLDALCAELQQRYDVAAETCRQEVAEFVDTMHARGLLRVT
jgi:PqqD family protein of HPr-rel-A system